MSSVSIFCRSVKRSTRSGCRSVRVMPVIKRHNFVPGRQTHGNPVVHNVPIGFIGMAQDPGRFFRQAHDRSSWCGQAPCRTWKWCASMLSAAFCWSRAVCPVMTVAMLLFARPSRLVTDRRRDGTEAVERSGSAFCDPSGVRRAVWSRGNEALIHQVVVAYQANARSGNRKQKGATKIAHTTHKPVASKGHRSCSLRYGSEPDLAWGRSRFPELRRTRTSARKLNQRDVPASA